jgi:two-component system OmpR family sensor kinase
MKKSSIFVSITVIFFVAALGVIIAYFSMIKYDKQKYTQELNGRYSIVSRVSLIKLLNSPVDEKFERDLKIYKMKVIKDDKTIKDVLKHGEILQTISARIGRSSIIYFKKNNYLLIESVTKKAVLLFDKGFVPYRNQILTIRIIFGSILLLLLGAYIWTIRKIKPIKKIKKEIDKFASGNLDIELNLKTDDEIAEVGQAFSHAVGEIKKLNNSRKLFLRNIMHELKTPITKGRITAEMIEEGKQKQRLISVFEKLESLLNEFIQIEQITVDKSFTNKEIVSVKEIIDEAINIAMVKEENYKIEIKENYEIKVDKKLFSLAVKNLLDNGIKYSKDDFVKIVVFENSISFYSTGEPLKEELSYYTEPFTQENGKAKNGFGLGLYIVDNILKAHNLRLLYLHENGENIFRIDGILKVFE